MANDVVLSAASRANLLSLQSTQKNIDVTQLRLATGKKVNSALDNPQSFFQANSLTNRASDLTRLLDGIGQSIRTIEAADKGITALTKLVEQASSVADSAQSEILASSGFAAIQGTKDLRGINLTTQSNGTIAAAEDFIVRVSGPNITGGTAVSAAIAIAANDTVYDLVAKINKDATIGTTGLVRASVTAQGALKIESLKADSLLRISDSATAANSLDADGFAFLGLDKIVGTEGNIAANRQGGTSVTGRTIYSQASTGAVVNGKYSASATLGAQAGFLDNAAADAATLSLIVDGTTYTSAAGAITDTSSIQTFVDTVNNMTTRDVVTARFNDTTGKIELEFGANVGQAEIRFTATAATTVDFGFGTEASDLVLANTNSASEIFKFSGNSANLDQYTKDFNKLRSQIDGIVEDANYRGVNLLGGDSLTSYFNEDRSNTLVTEGSDFTVAGLGISQASFLDSASVTKAINEVKNALDTIRAFGSSIANDLAIIQTRQTFTQETINTLKAGAADLVNADLNEEGANLLALQTAQQLGVTSLSLASQSQQSVLRLF